MIIDKVLQVGLRKDFLAKLTFKIIPQIPSVFADPTMTFETPCSYSEHQKMTSTGCCDFSNLNNAI